MNERFIEIAQQASTDLDPEEFMGASEVFLEKYAELILRECCNMFVELRTRPADLAVKDVKKHFGVES
jgi:hypothetical protein